MVQTFLRVRGQTLLRVTGKPDLLPCRGNGFPAIRRRLTHGRVRYNTRPSGTFPSQGKQPAKIRDHRDRGCSMRPLLLLGPTHPDPPDSRIAGPDHVTFPGVSHIDHLLPREPQARQSILEDSGIRLAVSQFRGNHDDLEELCQGGRAQLGFSIKSLAVRHQCEPVAFCKGLQHLSRLRVQAESLDREQAEKLRDRPGQVGRGSGARTLQEPAEELRGVDFRMPFRAPIQALLHDVKVDLTQLRGLDRGSSIPEEGGQDLPEVVLPFVGFDIDDGQVEVKQDRLDRHLEDHTPAYFRGSLFYPRDAAFDHFTAPAQDGIWRSPAQSLHKTQALSDNQHLLHEAQPYGTGPEVVRPSSLDSSLASG